MDEDGFELIGDVKPRIVEPNERILLRELLQASFTEKLMVEQEEIDVNASEPQEVDGSIIEDYFCENGINEDRLEFQNEVEHIPDSSRQESIESLEMQIDDDLSFPPEPMLKKRFSLNTGSYIVPQNLSASVMLTTPLSDLAKPLQRRNSLPILYRQDHVEYLSGYNFHLPKPPDRSQSTPVQSPSTAAEEGGEIENKLLLTSGTNLLEDDTAGEANVASPMLPVSGENEDVETSNDIGGKALEDVDSSCEKTDYSMSSSKPIDIPPDLSPPRLLAVCDLSSAITISPVVHERKNVHLKVTDLVFAMIITMIVFASYREAQRLRSYMFPPTCEQIILQDLHSKKMNFSYTE